MLIACSRASLKMDEVGMLTRSCAVENSHRQKDVMGMHIAL